MDVPVGVPRGPSGTFRHIAAPCESPVLQLEALRRLFHFWTRSGGTAMEASPPSPARKPPTGKKKKSDSPAAKAKRMERYRNDEDVQELLMQRDMYWMPQLEEALRNEKDHQRYIEMNAELLACLKEFGATNKELAEQLGESRRLCEAQAKQVTNQAQLCDNARETLRSQAAEIKRLRAMVDKRNGSRKSGGKVGRPRKHPAPVTAEENSDPQKQAADGMEVDSS